MSKIDLTQQFKQLYHPPTNDFAVVEVPPMTYLMADGHGDPNSAPLYAQVVEALYAVAYRAKFISKTELGRDYVVPPLEGLWWAEDMRMFTSARNKHLWDWTMLIMQPDWISEALHQRTLEELGRRRDLPGLGLIRRAIYYEGDVVQIMHIGSYDDEGAVLARLHREWLPQHGYVENGKHHEIYLNDPRRVAASKLKTVLRQPIRSA